MHEHHAGLPELPPTRPVEDSWDRRRRQYETWLASEEAELLIADKQGKLIGYAMLRFMPGPATWDVGESVAEIETLSVAPEARSTGVGARLVAAARASAQQAGAATLLVAAVHTNEAALRFYQREGFEPFYVLLASR